MTKHTDPKQVILVRKDLKMSHGKMAAQVAHASIACLLNRGEWTDVYDQLGAGGYAGIFKLRADPDMYQWMTVAFPKICLKVNEELEMLELYQMAKDAGLPCSLIRDSGRTVFSEPTYTCVGIGPANRDAIDKITGHLKLYH